MYQNCISAAEGEKSTQKRREKALLVSNQFVLSSQFELSLPHSLCNSLSVLKGVCVPHLGASRLLLGHHVLSGTAQGLNSWGKLH